VADMTKQIMDIFNNPGAAKVMATLDASGKIHVVPHGSIMAIAPDKVAFAKLMKGKTWENLEERKTVSLTVFLQGKPGESEGYQVKGVCEKLETWGELVDKYRQNMPSGVNLAGAGTIKVEEVYDVSVGPNCGARIA